MTYGRGATTGATGATTGVARNCGFGAGAAAERATMEATARMIWKQMEVNKFLVMQSYYL